jgi:hypothetical protein
MLNKKKLSLQRCYKDIHVFKAKSQTERKQLLCTLTHLQINLIFTCSSVRFLWVKNQERYA